MRVFVEIHFRGGASRSYVIPCKDGTQTVGTVKEEALTRCELPSSSPIGAVKANQFRLSLAGSGAILSENDAIGDVLHDGDFLCLGES